MTASGDDSHAHFEAVFQSIDKNDDRSLTKEEFIDHFKEEEEAAAAAKQAAADAKAAEEADAAAAAAVLKKGKRKSNEDGDWGDERKRNVNVKEDRIYGPCTVCCGHCCCGDRYCC